MHKYAAARAHRDDLIASLSSADQAGLSAQLRSAGAANWQAWRQTNQAVIDAYLEATPAARAKRKAWAAAQTRQLLTYAAILEAHRAIALLDARDDPVLWPGGGYRETTASAARLLRELCTACTDAWPFAAPNPFDAKAT